jgi:putative oxidoreductase
MNSESSTSEPCKKSVFKSSYRLFACAASYLQSPLLLAIRLYWGWQFFQTGKGKLMNLDRTAQFFQSLHIPIPKLNACLAGSTECFGGLLLLAGLGSRLVSIPLIFTMCVAYVTAEQEAVKNIFKDPDKFVTATPFLFLYAAVIILAFGPGKFSLDWLIGRKYSPTTRS